MTMTRRERIMAASQGGMPDRLPFFHYWRHSQIGWAERECRNRGMGMCWLRPCHVEHLHDVEVSEQQVLWHGQVAWRRTYTTPVGAVWQTDLREPGVGQWHANRSWKDVSPWQTERLIKEPEDYAVVQYMVEHTEYVADSFPIEQAMDWLGDDGVVLTALPHSPMQTLMIDWVGSEGGRIYYHLADHPGIVEGLYRALCKSREALTEIAAHAPAPIVMCGDNLDDFLVSPKLFERYFMPVYEQQAQVLHERGKLMAVHMDGRLAALKDLIAQTDVDIVEAFHPPPMGDISLGDALRTWPDKSIWVGFPSAIYDEGPESTSAFAQQLVQQAGDCGRVVVEVSTENLVSNENLLSLTGVLGS
ncbi:MAG: hypothetical protein HOM68_07700 [Gemmatimonadetes bacterium]|jgi:hypothetical protein|nr:hypothetical protein [Gemmatimonadota bacterium]MBT5146015.1 hypothetical protein [Gemmatimonadota bacterium]MBT5591906.1 hypothetical protein [Gemmatimonadota bacterium]MBT5961581.1 hypothetical protein [Gemmatimonadota bacterium]MBT7453731.1 hypothetical protein [Gemmatimonadota bacterium]